MILKAALLMWLVALALSFLAKGKDRVWMVRLFVGGFCLLLLAALVAVLRRVI